jgi:hypothetical protein
MQSFVLIDVIASLDTQETFQRKGLAVNGGNKKSDSTSCSRASSCLLLRVALQVNQRKEVGFSILPFWIHMFSFRFRYDPKGQYKANERPYEARIAIK